MINWSWRYLVRNTCAPKTCMAIILKNKSVRVWLFSNVQTSEWIFKDSFTATYFSCLTWFLSVLKVMSTCIICLEGWNLPKLPCCGQTCHKKCLKRWKRTLIEAAQGCPHCRTPFVIPIDNKTRTMLEDFMREVTPVSMLIAFKYWV